MPSLSTHTITGFPRIAPKYRRNMAIYRGVYTDSLYVAISYYQPSSLRAYPLSRLFPAQSTQTITGLTLSIYLYHYTLHPSHPPCAIMCVMDKVWLCYLHHNPTILPSSASPTSIITHLPALPALPQALHTWVW